MIKSWTLQNFKSVKELNKLDFAPLTIFAGANSSGKSTILQSILLTAQTLQNSVTNKSIILNGHISKFGSFNDILSNSSTEREITIGFELVPTTDREINDYILYSKYFFRFDEALEGISCEFTFSDTIRDERSEIYQLQPQLLKTNLDIKRKNQNKAEIISIVRSKNDSLARAINMEVNNSLLSGKEIQSLEFEVITPSHIPDERKRSQFSADISAKYVGAFLTHFLPTNLSILYDKIEEEQGRFIRDLGVKEPDPSSKGLFEKYINIEIIDQLKKVINDLRLELEQMVNRSTWQTSYFEGRYSTLMNEFNYTNYKNLLRSSTFFYRNFQQKLEDNRYQIKKALRKDLPKDNRIAPAYGPFDFSEYIDFYFKRSLKYLGPLRDEPKPVYPLSSSSDPKDVGFKGENTAAVLEVNKNTIIQYIHPAHFAGKQLNPTTISDTLISAVLNWLSYMGIAKSVDPADKGKLGHELRISTPGSSSLHDLTHVGVGVSQVLPILVLSLLADADSTLIFEQPELHLNPKVQTRLADFFFSMTLLNKQCLVETHSEYLINRLRYNVATSNDHKMSDSIVMYFVEKEGQNSTYKKVKINRYGVIDNWPKGFFDENEETAAAILKAGFEKRKNESKNDF